MTCRVKRNSIAAVLAGFVAHVGGALAHTQDGSLGDPRRVDRLLSGHLLRRWQRRARVDGGAGAEPRPGAASAVSVVAYRGIAATSTADTTGGDVPASPLVFVNGGDGVYNVFVSKTGSGASTTRSPTTA